MIKGVLGMAPVVMRSTRACTLSYFCSIVFDISSSGPDAGAVCHYGSDDSSVLPFAGFGSKSPCRPNVTPRNLAEFESGIVVFSTLMGLKLHVSQFYYHILQGI